MSNQTTVRPCQLVGCADAATKHWFYTNDQGVTEASPRHSSFGIGLNHLDLCDRHAEETRTRWGAVVLELDEECHGCPQQRRAEGDNP